MRTKQILTILSALLICMAAHAYNIEKERLNLPAPFSISLAQWTLPEPETVGFSIMDGTTSTDTLYLYNVGAKMYFTEGNAWGTQASAGTSGLKVYFAQYLDEESNWDGSTYLIWNFSLAKNAWRNLFIDSETSMYVDHGGQGSNCWMFQIEDNESTFRILPGVTNGYNEQTLGYKGYVGMTENLEGVISPTMSPLLDPDNIDVTQFNAYHIDWAFVTKEAYERQKALVAVYLTAMELKAKIEELSVKAPDLDTSTEMAVYNNTNSSIDELNAALESLSNKYDNYLGSKYSPTNPLSMDEFVGNTTFDQNHYGWTSTTRCTNNMIATNQCSVAGPDGNFYFTTAFWENWNPNPFTGKMYTELAAIAPGVYRLELAAFANGGSGSYVYMNNDNVEVTTGTKPYKYEVISVINTNTIEIGLEEVAGLSNWLGIDNCHLTYYGNTTVSYAYLMAETAKTHVIPEGAYYQTSAKETYDAVVAATAGPTTIDDAIAKQQQLNDAWATFCANIDAYKVLSDALNVAKEAIDLGYDYAAMIAFAADVEELLNEGQMTTEEALRHADTLLALIQEAYAYPPIGGKIMLFTNLNFDDGNNGWLVDTETVAKATSSAPQVAGLSVNPNGERWNANFDYYQIATGLPNGVYKLQAQAFYRTSSAAAAESGRESDQILAWIYINGCKKEVRNVMYTYRTYDELFAAVNQNVTDNCYCRTDVTGPNGEAVYTPRQQNSASAFFQLGDYENEVYGLVTDGTLRIGIMSEGSIGDRWTLFDNFRVTYCGMDEDALSEILADKIAAAEEMGETDMAIASKEALNTAISAGSATVGGSGEQMFEAIQAIDAAIDEAKESVKLYEELTAVQEKLANAIETAYNEGTGSPEAFDDADNMLNDILNARENGTWSNEQVIAKIAEVEDIITELKKPAGEASDDNPIDYTCYIVNPTFDTIGDFTGWAGSGWGAGGTKGPNAERYQMNFDTYQDILVPAGTYKLSVNGFFRSGSAYDDWYDYLAQQRALAENPNYVDPTLTAFLYATTSEGTYSVALPHASAGWVESPYGIESESQVEDIEYVVYIPNTMLAADTYFHTPKVDEQGNEYYPYNVSVILKVGEDTKLRIGVKRDAEAGTPAGNCTIVDDFQLICYGAESTQTPSIDASTVGNVQMGDVNGDGEVDLSDAIMVTYYSLEVVPANFVEQAADMNGDGEIDLSDAITIIYTSLGVYDGEKVNSQ